MSDNKRWAKKRRSFFGSGLFSLSIEHFLAMFPATILVPRLINDAFDYYGTDVVDVALVLFTSGIGTLIFWFFQRTNRHGQVKIPAYLGSSFAFIGITILLVLNQMNYAPTPRIAYAHVTWAYVFAGIILFLFSLLFRTFKNKKIRIDKVLSLLLPPAIVGPSISLIGLALAGSAVENSGFSLTNGIEDASAVKIAMITLATVITITVIRIPLPKMLRNSALAIGMTVGYVVAWIMSSEPLFMVGESLTEAQPLFRPTFLYFPPNFIHLALSILPATILVSVENMMRTTVIINMDAGKDKNQSAVFIQSDLPYFRKSLRGHGVATAVAGFLGSVPNTLYAENIAVMSINDTVQDSKKRDTLSWTPYICAAVYAIVVAIIITFSNHARAVLLNIPNAVIGGVGFFLFGIVAAPGIQLLVDRRVDYKKVSSQVLTATVLIFGISGVSFFGLSGMNLGLAAGFILNCIFIICKKWFGNLGRVYTKSKTS